MVRQRGSTTVHAPNVWLAIIIVRSTPSTMVASRENEGNTTLEVQEASDLSNEAFIHIVDKGIEETGTLLHGNHIIVG